MTRFLGSPDHRHVDPERTGVLLVNLGTPDAPTPRALRRYLGQFLADPRVIEAPRWLWRLILHGVILRIRPRRSAAMYAKVWTDEGSPLLVHSRRQADAIAERLRASPAVGPIEVALGMRYGNPSVHSALESLRARNVRRLIVLPLYPQYAGATTGSTFDAVASALARWRWVPELHFVTHYHDDPAYIEALAGSIADFEAEHGRPDRLLFSFHGLPRRYLDAGDPYHCQCHKTARLVAEHLEREPSAYAVSFQSRVGREEWLRPYTDECLVEWGAAGLGTVYVVCPGFAADCLETLEEIAITGREQFTGAGGGTLRYIPALNTDPSHIDALRGLIERRLPGFEPPGTDRDRAERAGRARALGAPD